MLVQLTYWSKITNHCSAEDSEAGKCQRTNLEALQVECARRNTENGITGCMLQMDDHFLQTIEGDSVKVNELFHKIQQDDRHYEINLVVYQPITRRKFADPMMLIDTMNDEHRRFLLSYSSRVPFAFDDISPIAVDMIIHEIYSKIKKGRRFTDRTD